MIELPFPAAYGVEVADEAPARGPVREFARDGRVVDGGVLIEVLAEPEGWAGLVANAPESVSAAHTGIYSTPSPHVVCVVARGDAYFIDVGDPGQWWALDDSPVVAVRAATDESLLIFATPRRVVAIGPDGGVAWRTPRLAVDGIQLGEVVAGKLTGVADPRDDAEKFVIDLRTGRHEGGLSFPDER